jgi:hypothetical protein
MKLSDTMPKVYLSHRNLMALVSKLEREAAGEKTECAIVKMQIDSPAYRQSMSKIMVIAVPDEVYYGSQGRAAGLMHPRDEKTLKTPSTGVTDMPFDW